MAAHSREQSCFVQNRRSSHSLRGIAGSPWVARSLFFVLALAVAVGSVLTGVRVLFADVPIGGQSGLLSLYGVTVLVGVGLAVLSQLKTVAFRSAPSSASRAASVVSLAASSSAAPGAGDVEYRPFDAA